jgi:hypothetical protein
MKKDLVNTFKIASVVITIGSLFLTGLVHAAEPAAKADNGLADRVTQRKSALKTQLTTERSQRITKNCLAAQNGLKNILIKDKALAGKRQATYSELSTQLTTTIRKLNSQKVDITELKTAQMQLDAAMNKYLEDMVAYKATLEDIAKIECAADPSGFEATLISARQLRVKLADDGKQIKTAKITMVQALKNTSAELSSSKGSNQ